MKQSGEKTEYNKVSLQSQVYTPQWVVKFLVDNTLGKAYMEMFPDSHIKDIPSADESLEFRQKLLQAAFLLLFLLFLAFVRNVAPECY